MNDLETIVDLSHAFGTDHYVRGGGGNTSVKDAHTLWVKPSGTTLAGLTAETFVAMNREKINRLYTTATPDEPAARESLVKDLMAAAVENDAGRPSVEAPLHNVFEARFVVHTHPAWVNGLTCAREGAAACAEMFPDALWVEYIDPGYTLCMQVRERIEQYKAEHGAEPSVLMLKNHGVFVAADTPDAIHATYARIMSSLESAYTAAGATLDFETDAAPVEPAVASTLQELLGNDAHDIVAAAPFACVPGPLTPDHLVYSRAFPYTGEMTAAALSAYIAERGYAPKVISSADAVYGIGTSPKNASLALELAADATHVLQLTETFGGVDYMTTAAREFIENWEVESYRQQQVS